MQPTKLDYVDGKNLMEPGALRIGASSIAGYFTFSAQFFKELLHGDNGFTGSTPSVLGTVVHYCLETYIKNDALDTAEINRYLQNQLYDVPDLDIEYIHLQYPAMFMQAKNYLMTLNYEEAIAERFVMKEVRPGINIGGSIDLITRENGMLIINDYKTTSANSIASMTYNYELQLLTYSNVLKLLGEKVSMIRTINITTNKTGRTGKTGNALPDQASKIIVHERIITDEDWEKIDATFDIVSEAVEVYIANPHLRGIIAQDRRVQGLKCLYTKFNDEEEI